jgi:UPF0755 protein
VSGERPTGSPPNGEPAQAGTLLRRDLNGGRVRGGTYRPRTAQPPADPLRSLTRIIFALAAAGLLLIAGFIFVPPAVGGALRSLADANPELMRFSIVADAVSAQLGDRLDRPAGTDPTPVEFVIAAGTSSRQITEDLVERELVTDRLAFGYLLYGQGASSRLLAGSHTLNRTMSPREVVQALQRQPGPGQTLVTVALRQGLRIEQVVAYLQTLGLSNFDARRFYELTTKPPAELRAGYPPLSIIPAGGSLEGFLGSGVFEVPRDITADDLLRELLDRWARSEAPAILDQAAAAGKDPYKVVVLASLTEREAAIDEERPLIAGVLQNRLDGLNNGNRLLNSDPTVVYAKDTMRLREVPIEQWPDYYFWSYEGIGSLAGFAVPPDLASFQTWHSRGLPDWPICTPGLASLRAAAQPDTADGYLYFVAKNDGSRTHAFARTYEEHLQNIRQYSASPSP